MNLKWEIQWQVKSFMQEVPNTHFDKIGNTIAAYVLKQNVTHL